MIEERLKEIKDNIDLRLEVAKHSYVHNVLVLEEKELYDYAELLKERISYLEKAIVRKEETITELEQERVPYTNEYVDKVEKENEELKKQLKGTTHCYDEEEHRQLKEQLKHCYCERTDCSGRIKDSKQYDSLVQKVETQQQAFIKYLEDEINSYKNKSNYRVSDILGRYDLNEIELNILKEILQKYKEIIGGNKDD